MATEKQQRWSNASDHYLQQNILLDVLLEDLETELQKYSIKENSNPAIIRQKQHTIQQLRRYQTSTLQAILHSANVISELLHIQTSNLEQIKNQNQLIETFNIKSDEK